MRIERRVSATYKDLPGGQLLGPTFDYTHRLLDPDLAGDEVQRHGGRALQDLVVEGGVVLPRPTLEESRALHHRASDERFALGADTPVLTVRELR